MYLKKKFNLIINNLYFKGNLRIILNGLNEIDLPFNIIKRKILIKNDKLKDKANITF